MENLAKKPNCVFCHPGETLPVPNMPESWIAFIKPQADIENPRSKTVIEILVTTHSHVDWGGVAGEIAQLSVKAFEAVKAWMVKEYRCNKESIRLATQPASENANNKGHCCYILSYSLIQ